MRKLRCAIVLLAGLSLVGCCTSAGDGFSAYQPIEPKPGSKEAEIETMQKATALAQGALAWEVVQISDIQHDAKNVKWVARTRSLNLRCTADPDGSNSYCE